MNTNDTLNRISAMFVSEESFLTMMELVDELDLEVRDIMLA